MKTLTLVLALFLAVPVVAQERHSLKLPAAIFVSTQVADLSTTAWAVHSGHGIEGNSVMGSGVGATPILLKVGSTTAILVLTSKLAVKHPKVASVTLYSLSGIMGSVAARNARIAGAR